MKGLSRSDESGSVLSNFCFFLGLANRVFCASKVSLILRTVAAMLEFRDKRGDSEADYLVPAGLGASDVINDYAARGFLILETDQHSGHA